MKHDFYAYRHIYRYNKKSQVSLWFWLLIVLTTVILFLPWTQNIRAEGKVTTLRQEQRPQQVNTIIAGRVEKWFVKEGDHVQKGDTILRLSEVKPDYLDPGLLNRTEEQIEAKQSSLEYYQNKVVATETQIDALQNALKAKPDTHQKQIARFAPWKQEADPQA